MRFIATLFLFFAVAAFAEEAEWQFPKTVEFNDGYLVIHSPQVIAWPEFEEASLLSAVEYHPPGGKTIYTAVEISAKTDVDVGERVISLSDRKIVSVTEGGEEKPAYAESLSAKVRESTLDVPLDLFLVSVAQDAIETDEPKGFNSKPPHIVVATTPTIVLSVLGEPQYQAMESSPYSVLTNASWPVIKRRDKDEYYLLYRNSWWQANQLDELWWAHPGRPVGIQNLDPEGAFKDFLVEPESGSGISIRYATEPTELIVLNGEPELEEIDGTRGLSFTTNTQSPLFSYKKKWYFLAAGRWFTTKKLDKPRWKLVKELPDAFADIPADHDMAYIRASVAGTVEARTALLESKLPQKKTVSVDEKLELDDQFDGQPQWERIPSTKVVRAINSPYDIFEFQGVYYLCYQGAWYTADRANGPWDPALRVPDVIYEIPADSPAYPVTQVVVTESTSNTVVYAAPTSYYTGVYGYYGFPVYGTGWYWPPYFGLYWYWPRYMAYGHGSYYNPITGGFGGRSVWYGPYGGYSYNHRYNPRTGRRGYTETAWDGDEWASYGESYNPRTGIYSETERYYNDDHHRLESEREIARGDRSIQTEREIDFDDGWGVTSREGSEGGHSYVEHHRQSDGSIVSEGEFTTGDGRTGDIERTIDHGERTTKVTGDNGGGVVSKKDGDGRSTLGKGSDGDLYAGHNGNIFKKDENGWSHYDRDDGWSEVDRPDRGSRENTWANNADRQTRERKSTSWSDYSREQKSSRMNQLNRDAYSRNHGNRQFNQRRSYNHNRSFNRGMSRGRMGGGFRR